MKKVKLLPRTKKGKERIKQWGDEGTVKEIRGTVLFSQDKGPWLLVTAGDRDCRWIHAKNDKDFTIEVVE